MIDDTKEYIIASAIHYDDKRKHVFQSAYGIETGFVIGCFRHPLNPFPTNFYFNQYEEGELKYPTDVECLVNQGFITSYGRFVNRGLAKKIAVDCGQIKETEVHGSHLFSEDVFKYQKYRAE